MGMQADDVAKFLVAMDPDRAAKIIGEFKTPPEAKMISTVLDRIRVGGTTSALGSASAAITPRSPGTGGRTHDAHRHPTLHVALRPRCLPIFKNKLLTPPPLSPPPDQSFSDALQSARQSSNSSDANVQAAPPPPPPVAPAQLSTKSTDSPKDTSPSQTDSSSEPAAHETTPEASASAEPPPAPASADAPEGPPPKLTGKTQPADPLPPIDSDLATQAALTTVLPNPIPLPIALPKPLPKPQILKPATAPATPPVAATSESPPEPQLHSAPIARIATITRNKTTTSNAQKPATPSPSPIIAPEAASVSINPAPAPDTDPASKDPSNVPDKSPLALKPDSTIPAATNSTTLSTDNSKPTNPDAATLAAANPDTASITKPTLSTINSSTPSSDPSAVTLSINGPTPLTSQASQAKSASPPQDLPRANPAQRTIKSSSASAPNSMPITKPLKFT